MAKKVRKVKKRRKKKTSTGSGPVSAEQPVARETSSEQTLSATEQFRFDYAYVIKDLRRVLLLAGAMFTLLIILNLILQ